MSDPFLKPCPHADVEAIACGLERVVRTVRRLGAKLPAVEDAIDMLRRQSHEIDQHRKAAYERGSRDQG